MGNDEDRRTRVIELLEKFHDLGAGYGIERTGRFVGQYELRLHRDRAGNRDALALAAGKLIRTEIHPVL